MHARHSVGEIIHDLYIYVNSVEKDVTDISHIGHVRFANAAGFRPRFRRYDAVPPEKTENPLRFAACAGTVRNARGAEFDELLDDTVQKKASGECRSRAGAAIEWNIYAF